jgi:hypothetical protein
MQLYNAIIVNKYHTLCTVECGLSHSSKLVEWRDETLITFVQACRGDHHRLIVHVLHRR